MILTDLKHVENQVTMTPVMKKAFAFLRKDLRELADGKIEIDGTRVFAIVQRYETIKTDTPKFEYHRKYIDIQLIVSGEEIIGWAPEENMTIDEPYNAEKDICFGGVAAKEWTPMHLHAGQLAVLYPEDGHAPKLAYGAASQVMKIVVKVAV
jgi:biofilm protein TabA